MTPKPRSRNSSLTNALALGKGTLVSRVLGFVRDALFALALGGGSGADAFLVAFRLPNFLRRLVAEGSLSYAFTPVYLRLAVGRGLRTGFAFARAVLLIMVLAFAVLALCAALSATPLVLALAPGLLNAPQTLHQAAFFLTLCLPYLPLAAGAAVSSGMLMAHGKFRWVALSPVVLNCVLISVCLGAIYVYGYGAPEVGVLLCMGVVLGGAGQWLCQVPDLHRAGFRLRGPLPLWHSLVHRTVRRVPVAAFGASGHQLTILAATIIASFMQEGSISALYFSERLLEFPMTLIGASLGLATLPGLALQARSPDRTAFSATLDQAVRMALACSIPAAVGLACIAAPLVSLMFGYGAFGWEAQSLTGKTLAAYCLGLPALTAARPLLSGLNALGDTKATAWNAVASLVMTLGFGAVALIVGARHGVPLSVWSVALCVSLAAWGSTFLLFRSLRRNGVRSALPWLAVIRSLVAAAFMTAVVLTLRRLELPGPVWIALSLPLGGLTYVLVSLVLGCPEMRRLFPKA